MGTNWFMPALVKSRFGESGIKLDEGTIVCCFSRKNSRKELRISALVMQRLSDCPARRRSQAARHPESSARDWSSHRLQMRHDWHSHQKHPGEDWKFDAKRNWRS